MYYSWVWVPIYNLVYKYLTVHTHTPLHHVRHIFYYVILIQLMICDQALSIEGQPVYRKLFSVSWFSNRCLDLNKQNFSTPKRKETSISLGVTNSWRHLVIKAAEGNVWTFFQPPFVRIASIFVLVGFHALWTMLGQNWPFKVRLCQPSLLSSHFLL